MAKARARDAQLLADCGGVVKDTPRQDILPPLTTGLLFASPGAGTLFPQPRLQGGVLMDQIHGHGWRLVNDGSLALVASAGVNLIDLARAPELDGVVAAWMQRHGCHAALLRPDHCVFGSASDASSAAALLAAWQATSN